MGIDKLAKVINIDLKVYNLNDNTPQEQVKSVELAKSEGRNVIISPGIIQDIARNLGLSGIPINSGRDAIWWAIEEAKQIGTFARREKEKTKMRTTILDLAHEGIIAMDKEQNIIFSNSLAQSMLGVAAGEGAVGKSVEDYINEGRLLDIILSEKEYFDEIIDYKGTLITINKVLITIRNEIVGKVLTFDNAIQIQKLEGKIRAKLHIKGHYAKHTFKDILGESEKMRETITIASSFAQTQSNIVLYGESGTGKELFAQSIHNASSRSRDAFVAINCAAIPEQLLESELFGYTEGAFTGAVKGGKIGLFEIAHNGTIFLDEISEFPIGLQGRLLRVIQEREIMRLGDNKITPINVRIIVATNKDLKGLIETGKFRLDLYYRLHVLKVTVPPLRERGDDVILIAQHYIQQFCKEASKEALTFSKEAVDFFISYRWEGNVRELRNICEALVVLCNSNTIKLEDIRRAIGESLFMKLDSNNANSKGGKEVLRIIEKAAEPVKREIEEREYEVIVRTLEKNNGNRERTADELGMSRVTLWRRLKKYNLI
jgi:transcriptional regulator with PAS, ATPase and Fis domain